MKTFITSLAALALLLSLPVEVSAQRRGGSRDGGGGGAARRGGGGGNSGSFSRGRSQIQPSGSSRSSGRSSFGRPGGISGSSGQSSFGRPGGQSSFGRPSSGRSSFGQPSFGQPSRGSSGIQIPRRSSSGFPSSVPSFNPSGRSGSSQFQPGGSSSQSGRSRSGNRATFGGSRSGSGNRSGSGIGTGSSGLQLPDFGSRNRSGSFPEFGLGGNRPPVRSGSGQPGSSGRSFNPGQSSRSGQLLRPGQSDDARGSQTRNFRGGQTGSDNRSNGKSVRIGGPRPPAENPSTGNRGSGRFDNDGPRGGFPGDGVTRPDTGRDFGRGRFGNGSGEDASRSGRRMIRSERPSFSERHQRLEDRLRQRGRETADRGSDSRRGNGFRDRDFGDRDFDGRRGDGRGDGAGRFPDSGRFGRGDRHDHDHEHDRGRDYGRGRGHRHHDHHHHHRHHRWYAGNWGGDWYYSYYGPQWNYWWDRYPWLDSFGLSIWGFDPIASAFGYYGYSNPYITHTVVLPGTLYDYSQPLLPADPVFDDWTGLDDPDSTVLPPGVSPEAMQSFDLARQAFARGNHEEALRLTDSVLREMPSDAALHEFRALTLFAQGEYQAAAETLYAVLSAGPGWDWATMSSLYSEPLIYTAQLRHLETYRRAKPDDAAAAFVLAYHYITCGHTEAAIGQLRQVLEIQPDDQLAGRLLRQLNPEADLPALPEVTRPPEQVGEIDPAALPGTWHARRQNGDTFELVLEQNGQFQWRFTRNGREQEVKGAYAIERDGVLALEMSEGGTMLAQVNLTNGSMDFYLLGDTRGAEPLHFRRGPRQPAPPVQDPAAQENPPSLQQPAPLQDPATGLEAQPGPRLQPAEGFE